MSLYETLNCNRHFKSFAHTGGARFYWYFSTRIRIELRNSGHKIIVIGWFNQDEKRRVPCKYFSTETEPLNLEDFCLLWLTKSEFSAQNDQLQPCHSRICLKSLKRDSFTYTNSTPSLNSIMLVSHILCDPS